MKIANHREHREHREHRVSSFFYHEGTKNTKVHEEGIDISFYRFSLPRE